MAGSPQMMGKGLEQDLVPDLDDKEKIEYRKLKRRFGNQPTNFSQAKKQKVHDLVDDAENDPRDRSPRKHGRGGRPSWDPSKKPDT
mmetsp:Transcript_2778/g.3814  ORF Transcript_2778/g.3814 Transcript_2778/m.3814 type:complete len:86 (-) Transcript_2778:330-587(-)